MKFEDSQMKALNIITIYIPSLPFQSLQRMQLNQIKS